MQHAEQGFLHHIVELGRARAHHRARHACDLGRERAQHRSHGDRVACCRARQQREQRVVLLAGPCRS